MLKKELYASGDTHSDEDVLLRIKVDGVVPFLVLEDGLIDKLTVLTETLDNNDSDITIYHKDGDDDTDEVQMLNISSTIAGLYSMSFIDSEYGYLTSLPITQTLNENFFKNQTIQVKTKVLPSMFAVDNGVSLLFNTRCGFHSLPKPDNNFGNKVTIKTISITGIDTFSIPNRFKLDTDDGSFYRERSLLPLLEIDASAFKDWDPKTIPFYTLIQNSNGTFTTKYVGPLDTDKYYIPLQ